VVRQKSGDDVVLGANDDTISAELQAELQRELIVNGINLPESEDDIQQRMERIIAGYGQQAEQPNYANQQKAAS